MKICGMKVNHLSENLTAGPENPVFSWRAEGSEKNIRQLGYRVQVWKENGQACWDSGYVESRRMTGIHYEGEPLTADSTYSWRVECRLSCDGAADGGPDNGSTAEEPDDERITVICGNAAFETGLFGSEDWKGCFIGETQDHVYHLYRKAFSAGAGLKKAKLYICAMGHFEGWINGRRVSDHVLEPGWSDYNKTCFYTAYNVTELLQEGDNALVVKPGDGMFNVPGGRYVYYKRSYGRCGFLAQLELLYEDGSRQRIVTDDSWRMTESPVRFCCIYGGEDFDGRLMRKEYLEADYREGSQWEPVQQVEPPRGKLKAMPMEPMKVMRRYEPVKVTKVSRDTWLYDLGVNFSGWVRIRLRTDGSAAGCLVSMKPGELLDADGRVDQQMTRQNCIWNYIVSDEKEQEFAPDFTYTGFRYVEVTGAQARVASVSEENGSMGGIPMGDVPVMMESLTGEFLYPNLEQGGGFECSNQLFNGIHSIVLQAILSNTKSYFTDCPHREKLGWLEQVHLIGPSIMYNLQVQNLYSKIEQDMADSQRESGLVPDICPEYVTGFGRWHEGFVDSPEWGSACILGPWYAYKKYGDTEMLRRFYDVMKRYLDYLGSRTHHQVLHHGLGDWLDIGPCTPHSQNTPVPVVATCVYYYDLDVMRQIAEFIGRTEDVREYRERMEAVFTEYNLQFLDRQTGRYATGSQAAQAMSLVAGLVPEDMREKVIQQLREDVEKRKFAVTAGDVGHPFLVAALMKYGMSDLLNEMTNLTDTPGYGYQVVNGATTLTEEWDGPDPARPHGSQNHLMLGSIEEWFYGSLGGMDLIRGRSTLEDIFIAPRPEKGVDWVKAWTLHPCGRISVEWRRETGQIQVEVSVPPNVTAHLQRPDGTEAAVVGSGCYSYSFSEEEQ
ncbi:MAG: glycoside hydrolase family 78 protein [Acetatifactor sp.]|nr:glycoside hydrolase family 78 protein [Acetatifactor sp.]